MSNSNNYQAEIYNKQHEIAYKAKWDFGEYIAMNGLVDDPQLNRIWQQLVILERSLMRSTIRPCLGDFDND